MTVTSAIEWLKQNGYKYGKGASEEWETHYLYKRIDGSDCQCNGRPPNLGFKISSMFGNDSMSVGIRGESINGLWVDVGYYSMELDTVKALQTLEYTVISMWECAN